MNTTNSQAASIDTYEFRQLSANYGMAWTGTKESEQKHLKALVAHIDAKLAQAREEGRRDSHETNVTMLNLKLKAEDRASIAEEAWRAAKTRADQADESAEMEKEFSHSMETRAHAAESRLAEIQRALHVMHREVRPIFTGWQEMQEKEFCSGWNAALEQVLALLQPQGQADTSDEEMVFKDCHFAQEPKPGVLFFKSGSYNPDSGETNVTVTLRADGSIRLVKTDATLNPDMSPFLQRLLDLLQE